MMENCFQNVEKIRNNVHQKYINKAIEPGDGAFLVIR